MRRVLLCANPAAASGRAAERVERAAARLRARSLDVTFLPTEPEGRTPAAVKRVLDEARAAAPHTPFDAAVALGGDGTFADVAKGVLQAAHVVPLGLIPAGTANDQAKSLGIPFGDDALDAAVDVICGGHITWMDVGEVRRLEHGATSHRELFFDSVGFGFMADVLRARNASRERIADVPLLRDVYRDQAVYAGALFGAWAKSFVTPTKMDVDLVIDGNAVHWDDMLDVVVKNTAVYGGEWVLARDNAPDDGLMEVIPFVGRRELFSRLISDLKQLPDLEEGLELVGVEHSRALRGARIELSFSRADRPDVASQIDGEEWVPGRAFDIRVLRNRLPVLTPDR